jgi:5-methylcytosine-specific restriction endonuclease McrA
MRMISKKFDAKGNFVWVRGKRHFYDDEIIAMIVEWYGGECAWCGIDDLRVLTIDHVFPKGHPYRLADGLHAGPLCRWIVRNIVYGTGNRDAFRVLCRNCNHVAYTSDQQNPGNISWGATSK